MFRNSLVYLIILVLSYKHTSAAKILGIVPTPSYSHQITLRPIWKELSLRGHQVTVITTDPIRDPKLVNLTEIDIHSSYKLMNHLYDRLHKSNKFQFLDLILQNYNDILDTQLSKGPIKALIKNESMFDVVITESVLFEYQALAELYNCPKILISSFEISFMIYGYLGNPINPVSSPDFGLPSVAGQMSFRERLVSVLYQCIYFGNKLFRNYPARHEIMKKHFGTQVRTPQDILRDVDLVLTNINPIIHDVKSIGPNIIPIGGGIHILPPKPLPSDIQKYLDKATEGCVYFSLGTNSKSMYMSQQKIEILLETLGELPYKVLWKFELADSLTPPKNVKLIKWAPQQDILRHPNVKLFIMQGGIQSLEESIINHVPTVMMPMYGDQEANAKRMEYRGITRIIPHQPVPDKKEFKSIIMEVINNPKYKQNIIKTGKLLLDQPMPSLDKAIWWIEYVIRHKGAKHLKHPALDIPLYQYYCLDVIGSILLIFFVIYKIVALLLRLIKCLFCKKKSQNIEINKKKKKE